MSSSLPTPDNSPVAIETVSATDSPRRRWLGTPVLRSRIFWVTTPALALLALAIISSKTSLPTPIGNNEKSDAKAGQSVITAREWIVPASQTLLVSSRSAGDYVVLRGRLETINGEKIASTTSGEVAQALVKPGQYVKAGQKIVMLTTGVAPPVTTSTPLDEWHNQAESAQIAAAQQQEKLESRMAAANKEMERAKERVAVAQQRVTEARELIARLQKGEEVSHSTTPTAKPTPAATPPRATSSARADGRKAALRESQKLQDEASSAEEQAQTAQKTARKAQDLVDARQQKLQAAVAAVKASEKNQSLAAPSENEEGSAVKDGDEADATKAVTEARQALAVANSRAAAAQRDVARLQTRARDARNKANEAARRATQDLQVFEQQPEPPSSAPASSEPVRNRTGKVTVADAFNLARAAMKESDDAIADAERIQRKVQSYSRPVQTTRRQFERATQSLETAQRRMWENVPQMRTTQSAITAIRDGIVTWVVADKTVVKPGEALVAVGRPDHLEVVITDKSGIWKSLKPQMQVLALVQKQGDSVAPGQDNPAGSGMNIPSMARVLAIAPPPAKGGVARVRLAVHNPPRQLGNNQNGLSPRAFKPGMPVFFSVSKPSQNTALHIPTAAVRREQGGKTYVAVLSPLQNQKRDRLADQCRVEWREVFLAPGDGQYNRVKSGLAIGERVALQPNELYSFTLAYGEQATVRVEQI